MLGPRKNFGDTGLRTKNLVLWTSRVCCKRGVSEFLALELIKIKFVFFCTIDSVLGRTLADRGSTFHVQHSLKKKETRKSLKVRPGLSRPVSSSVPAHTSPAPAAYGPTHPTSHTHGPAPTSGQA